LNQLNQFNQSNLGSNGFNPFNSEVNSKKNTFDAEKYNITLSSWVGSPEIFEECTEIISYVKNSTNYEIMGAELPKGILFEGPAGTGKTLLAKAIASETNSSFISVTASEFIELYVGMGASRVRDLFSEAREISPCIIFIDEIDAIGKQRGGVGANFGGNDEREQTLNQLLAEMDGFNDNTDILVLAATNRKDVLDKALLRPGRFDRIIKIGLPDKTSRQQIIKFYLDKKNTDESVDINTISELTDGYSGAELKNLINEAAILAARIGATKITSNEISNALEKNMVGLIRNVDTRLPETKLRVSVHEIGHAFITLFFSKYFELQKVSIKSTYNGAGGYTLFREKSEYIGEGLYTKDILYKRLIITMGGKAAESIWYGNEQMSLGANQDLKQANSLARKMIGLFGMGDELETFYNENIDSSLPDFGYSNHKYSEKIKESFDMEALKLVSKAYGEAKEIIEKNSSEFNDLVNLLFEKEILNINDFKK
jgi:cell division protease FtsH